MPLHSTQALSPTAVLGLWHLTEAPAALWPHLPAAAEYRALLPVAGPARQAQWLAARALVHRLATELLATQPARLQVLNDATGRPYLAGGDPDLAVSLSHSGAWVAAVLARSGRAGVDVELVRDKARRLAGRFLSPTEQAAVAAEYDPDTHHTLLWSAKEALYKLAARRGLIFSNDLRLGAFAPGESGIIPATLVLGEVETRHSVCYSRPAPGYVLTYCHEPAG